MERVSSPSRPPRGGRRVPVAPGSRAVASGRRPRRARLRAFLSFHRVARAPSDTLGGGGSPPAALRRAPRGTAHARRFRGPRRRDIRRSLGGSSGDRAHGGSSSPRRTRRFAEGRSPRSVGQPPPVFSGALWRLRCCCPFSSTTPPAPRGSGKDDILSSCRSSPSAVSSCPTTRTRIRSRRPRPCPSRFYFSCRSACAA